MGRSITLGQQVLENDAQRDLQRLVEQGRIVRAGDHASLRTASLPIFLLHELGTIWDSASGSQRTTTSFRRRPALSSRCVLMTTDPGDLVLDPTCGSGTTAYVAEQWGRRWITIDTSRVPLRPGPSAPADCHVPLLPAQGRAARARRRIRLRAEAEQEGRGSRRHRPAHHAEEHRQRRAARTKKSWWIGRKWTAGIVRVTGPLCCRGHDPDPRGLGRRRHRGLAGAGGKAQARSSTACWRCCGSSPIAAPRRWAGRSHRACSVRPPARRYAVGRGADAMSAGRPSGDACRLSCRGGTRRTAQATLRRKPVAIVFGPENGAVSEKLVYEAASEARRSRATRTSTSSASPSSRTRASWSRTASRRWASRRPTSRRRRT